MIRKQRIEARQLNRLRDPRGIRALQEFMHTEWREEARYHHLHREEPTDHPPRSTDYCPTIGQMLKLLSSAYIVEIKLDYSGWEMELSPTHRMFHRAHYRGRDELCDLLWDIVLQFLEGKLFISYVQNQRRDPNLPARWTGDSRQITSDADLSTLRDRMDNLLAYAAESDPAFSRLDPTRQMAQRLIQREQTIPLWRS